MDYKKLVSGLNEVLAGGRDTAFLTVFNGIHCMSTARVYAVLNTVVGAMDEGEVYVEVGTYQGGSMISALLGNNARAIGVDSFEEFKTTNNYETTRSNLEKFGVLGRVSLVNSNFQTFFTGLQPDFKISVYSYDGAHGYEVQLAGMEAAWNFLADGAIIIVDDYVYSEVHLAVNQFIANHINSVKPLLIIDPIEGLDPVWWNGVVVLRKV